MSGLLELDLHSSTCFIRRSLRTGCFFASSPAHFGDERSNTSPKCLRSDVSGAVDVQTRTEAQAHHSLPLRRVTASCFHDYSNHVINTTSIEAVRELRVHIVVETSWAFACSLREVVVSHEYEHACV